MSDRFFQCLVPLRSGFDSLFSRFSLRGFGGRFLIRGFFQPADDDVSRAASCSGGVNLAAKGIEFCGSCGQGGGIAKPIADL
jgi:hypothetical protein